jgi:hypothetical protein
VAAQTFNLVKRGVSGNAIEQTANTYNLNACSKALIKASKAKLLQLRLALLNKLFKFIIVN